jgi:hypothetical protein
MPYLATRDADFRGQGGQHSFNGDRCYTVLRIDTELLITL